MYPKKRHGQKKKEKQEQMLLQNELKASKRKTSTVYQRYI